STLPEREQYIEMELLRGRMANHSFVVHQNDRKSKIAFDDDRYLRYVPIRLPWTMCVKEGLPPGFAGALVNQTHIFHDLYVLVDEKENKLWEAIDGRRSISEIVEWLPTSALLAREFFEKLYWYDQVVFDASET